MRRIEKKLSQNYPTELPMTARVWTLKQGDILYKKTEEAFYRVSKTTRSLVPGELPIIELERLACSQPPPGYSFGLQPQSSGLEHCSN